MKRFIGGICLLMVICLFSTGCGSNSLKTKTCTIKQTVADGIEMDSRYEISYKNKYVTKIVSTETVEVEDSYTREQYKDSVEAIYEPYKDLKYYDTSVSIDGDKIISIANIDYEHMDIDEFLKINTVMKPYFKDGKLLLSDALDMYKSLGVDCD